VIIGNEITSESTPTSENSKLLPEQQYTFKFVRSDLIYIVDIRSDDRHLAAWCERVTRLSLQFNTLVDAHPTKYVDALLSAYHVSSSDKDIRDAVLTLSRYQNSIQRYEHEILQLAGVGSEWSQAHQLSNRVREVVRWIEEVLCLAVVDPDGLVVSHAAKQLMFQVVEPSP
jgi:hypothetical protein